MADALNCMRFEEKKKKKRGNSNSRSEFLNSFEIYTLAVATPRYVIVTLAPYFYIYITFILLGSRWRTLIHKLYTRRTVQPTHPSLSITEHRIVLAWPLDTSRIVVESRRTMTSFLSSRGPRITERFHGTVILSSKFHYQW